MVVLTPLGQVLLEQGRLQMWLASQLSARIGRPVYRQEVGRWVAGQHVPAPDTRSAIAEILGVPAERLWPSVHDSGVSTPPPGADDGIGTKEAA